MKKLVVYDPAMCCSTGVCGPEVDPVLPRFQEDFHWLANQGVAVERFNLAQQPQEFTGSPTVKAALAQDGTKCLPLIVVDGVIVSKGRYPERAELSEFVGIGGTSSKAKALPVLAGGGSCAPGSGCC